MPLNDSTLEVLKQLDAQQEYLFMNQQTGKPYTTTITKVWDRLRKAAGLPHLRLHDLRHQFASFLVNDGRTLYVAEDTWSFRSRADCAMPIIVHMGFSGDG